MGNTHGTNEHQITDGLPEFLHVLRTLDLLLGLKVARRIYDEVLFFHRVIRRFPLVIYVKVFPIESYRFSVPNKHARNYWLSTY